MKMTGSSPVMTGLDRCVQYVNSKGGWYNTGLRIGAWASGGFITAISDRAAGHRTSAKVQSDSR
jgi:hypothetical protein